MMSTSHESRATKRLVHTVCQRVEQHLRSSGEVQPPPLLQKGIHPMSAQSRASGSSAFGQELVRRFYSRGGNYVSVKDEADLAAVGLTSGSTRVAGRLAGEFAGRYLYKCSVEFADFMNSSRDAGQCPSIVLVQDASTICHQPVPLWNWSRVGEACA